MLQLTKRLARVLAIGSLAATGLVGTAAQPASADVCRYLWTIPSTSVAANGGYIQSFTGPNVASTIGGMFQQNGSLWRWMNVSTAYLSTRQYIQSTNLHQTSSTTRTGWHVVPRRSDNC